MSTWGPCALPIVAPRGGTTKTKFISEFTGPDLPTSLAIRRKQALVTIDTRASGRSRHADNMLCERHRAGPGCCDRSMTLGVPLLGSSAETKARRSQETLRSSLVTTIPLTGPGFLNRKSANPQEVNSNFTSTCRVAYGEPRLPQVCATHVGMAIN